MNIYFAVSDEMIEKYGMPENHHKSGTYYWTLNRNHETFLAGILATSAGGVVNAMMSNNMKLPYTICQATVASEQDIVEALRTALVGDVVSKIPVIITELLRILK